MPNQATEFSNKANEKVSKFYLAHGYSQCLSAVDGSHLNIKNLKQPQMIT